MGNNEGRLKIIRSLLVTQQCGQIAELFSALQPYDQAEIISMLTPEERQQVLTLFNDEALALIFEELETDIVTEMLQQLGQERVSRVLGEMSPDDAVDLLGELRGETAEELIELMEEEDAEDVKALLTHPETTAGGLMTKEYITIKRNWKVREALEGLREVAPKAETIYYLYVTDRLKRLVGVVSLRQLIIAGPEMRIEEIMSENVISIPVGADQEQAARMIEKYDFLALPVVDANKRLVGIVTVDDVIDVLEDEATEDISRLAGIRGVSEAGDLRVPAMTEAFKRLPWLVILLGMDLISGNIIARFEGTLQSVVLLAIFIPVITDMAGNTGTQALAVVVRGLAVGEFTARDFFWLLGREAGVGIILATVNGLLIAVATWYLHSNPWLGLIIGFSLWVTLFVGTLAGAVVPLIFHQFKIDPAVASGPFITTINDIIGLTIYFTVATSLLHRL